MSFDLGWKYRLVFVIVFLVVNFVVVCQPKWVVGKGQTSKRSAGMLEITVVCFSARAEI